MNDPQRIRSRLLPRFGGSAGVWISCMMFFQIVLLLGYLYSFWITKFPRSTVRTVVHLSLVAVSLSVLPLRPQVEWTLGNPTESILVILTFSVGLPFFVLPTTSPLLQSWYAGSRKEHLPYWLFALSNSACLLALLAYPLTVEPMLTAHAQLRWWSIGYLLVAVLVTMGTATPEGLELIGIAEDARYGTSAIVRSDRGARACRRENQAPLCPSQDLLAPVRAQERRYQLSPRRVTHPCGKLTINVQMR